MKKGNQLETLGQEFDDRLLVHIVKELAIREGVTDPGRKLALTQQIRNELAGGEF